MHGRARVCKALGWVGVGVKPRPNANKHAEGALGWGATHNAAPNAWLIIRSDVNAPTQRRPTDTSTVAFPWSLLMLRIQPPK